MPAGACEMPSADGLVETLASIIAEGGDAAPLRICQACVEALPIDGAAITMMTGADRQEPVCASDELSGRIDELQFSLGEGPCVEAYATGRPVLISDLRDGGVDQRWPVFSVNARRTAARGLYVLPLQMGAIKVGVMDLYSLAPGLLQQDQLTGALRGADAALMTLLGRRGSDGSGGSGGSGDGSDGSGDGVPPFAISRFPLHRAEVHQATGMIVAQADVTAETALAMLRAFAFAHERSIDEVARDVVARRLRFEEGSR